MEADKGDKDQTSSWGDETPPQEDVDEPRQVEYA